MYQLTDTEVTFYQDNGYLKVESLLTKEEKDRLVEGVGEIQSWAETPGKWMIYYEPQVVSQKKILCRTENFIPYSEKVRQIMCGEKIMNSLCQLLGEPVYLYKDKINYKQPGGNGFLPHQDVGAFQSVGTKNHITVLIAIDEFSRENGCLEVATSHREIWKEHKILEHNEKGGIVENIVNTLTWEPILMQPGDVLFFGSYIPHRSGPNLTETSRRALYLTYNPVKEGNRYEQYYIDKRKNFPPDCEREPGRDYSTGEKIYNLANPIKHFD
jgi:hypothetical protein